MPAPIVGRWGQIDECEACLLEPPEEQVRSVYTDALNKEDEKKKVPLRPIEDEKKDEKEKANELITWIEDGQLAESMAHYSERKSRWHTDVLALMVPSCPFMWIMRVVHKVRSPLMHLLNSMKTVDVLHEAVDEKTPLSMLVYGKADDFMREYEHLLTMSAWEAECDQVGLESRRKKEEAGGRRRKEE